MSQTLDPPIVRLSGFEPDRRAVSLLDERVAWRFAAAPLWLEDENLVVAVGDPANRQALRAIETEARRPLRLRLASYPDIRTYLGRVYSRRVKPLSSPPPHDILYRLGLLDRDALSEVEAKASPQESAIQAAFRLGLIDDDDLACAVGWAHYLPHVRSQSVEPAAFLSPLIPYTVTDVYHVLPLWWDGSELTIGFDCAKNISDVEPISQRVGLPLRPVLCSHSAWERLFRSLRLTGMPQSSSDDLAIVDLLFRQGKLSPSDVTAAQALGRQADRNIKEVLVDRGIVTTKEWLDAEATLSGIRQESFTGRRALDVASDVTLSDLLPARIARACGLLPLRRQDSRLIVGMREARSELIQLVEGFSGMQVEPRLIDPRDLEAGLERLYGVDLDSGRPPIVPDLGGLLLAMGMTTQAQVEAGRESVIKRGGRLGEQMVQLGFLDDTDLAEVLGLQAGVPYASLAQGIYDREIVASIPSQLAMSHMMLPLYAHDSDLWVAVADPWDIEGLQQIEITTGKRVWPLVAARSHLAGALERFFGRHVSSVSGLARRILDSLTVSGVLSQAQAAQALRRHAGQGIPLDVAIAECSPWSQQRVAQTLAKELGVEYVDLRLKDETAQVVDAMGNMVAREIVRDPVDIEVARLIDLEMAQRLTALPIQRTNGTVTVAFGDPDYQFARQELEAYLGTRIRPCMTARPALHEAIRRTLGRRNIGTYLLLGGYITRSQLNDALDLAQRSGVRLGKALLNRGYINEETLYRFLAEQSGLPFFDLSGVDLDQDVARMIDAETAREQGILPLAADDERVTVAMVDPLNEESLEIASRLAGRPIRPVLVMERDMEMALERIYSAEYLTRSTSELLERTPDDSAFEVLNKGQKIFLAVFVVVSIAWLVLDYLSYLIVINAISSLFYLSFSMYKFYLINRAMRSDLEVPVSDEELEALDDRDLPVYTILTPVFREANVLPDLLEGLQNLDYPTTKLDVKVLMEAIDVETIEAFRELNPPPHIQGIIVPAGHPQTKPKACNYGLIHARGEYVVIFDAEDIPDSDQLKRILVAFNKVDPNVVCIQAKLNYYNRRQNILTQWFTAEYSMWFDLFLPGLDATKVPIPLGGTSNHFKRDALVECGAWDPWNVTEDADLGIRLYKRGYGTAVVDTTTYEEANSQVNNWIRQRSRWLKGYFQTWMVHMRHPAQLIKEIGFKSFVSFQLVVGGTFFAALVNPIYWVLTTLWFLIEWQFIRLIYPGAVFYFGAICLFVGNFAFTYMNVAGSMRRGFYDAVKYALISPLYWGLMSIAGWKGFLQLIWRPHFWEKTIHGLYRGTPQVETGPQD